MGLFGKKKAVGRDRELDFVINEIKVDLSNNYKDNAVLGVKKLKALLDEKHSQGKLKDSDYTAYQETLKSFEADIKSFKRTY
ncbi:MAG: hypothetical protein IJJ89_01595 [Eubacterium sp.]|nr:hypothetical protein [Eubacterium sp.]